MREDVTIGDVVLATGSLSILARGKMFSYYRAGENIYAAEYQNTGGFESQVNCMGVTYMEGRARGPTGREEPVRFLVDSGATYSLLPEKVWHAIGLKPTREHSFTLADGSTITRKVSECYFLLSVGEGHTPVILGEADDEALLGVVTLKILGLVLDPFKRTLKPMRMLLAKTTPRAK